MREISRIWGDLGRCGVRSHRSGEISGDLADLARSPRSRQIFLDLADFLKSGRSAQIWQISCRRRSEMEEERPGFEKKTRKDGETF
jgi:hypothetical protein